MTTTKKEKLEKMLGKGKWSFVLWRGVVGCGLATVSLHALVEFMHKNKPFLETFMTEIILWPIAGVPFGLLMWNILNRKLERLKIEAL